MANVIFKGQEKAVNFGQLINEIEATPARSAWRKGVKLYACDLAENVSEYARYNEEEKRGALVVDKDCLLNGAKNWMAYACGGCGLVYSAAIAERLCTPSELKKTRGGLRNPIGRETWLQVEARALFQAAFLFFEVLRNHEAKENAPE